MQPHSFMNALQRQNNLDYIQRMQTLRKILPLTAGVLFMLVILWPEITAFLEKFPKSEMTFKYAVHGRNRLTEPRIQSTDEKGRPYYLAAKSALQKSNHTADLEAPQNKMQMEDGVTLEIKADTGFYNNLTKSLDYKNNVKLRSDTGYNLTTSLAHVKLQEKQAFGDQHVEGEGPTGTISAQGFEVTNEGAIHFKGKSRLIIDKNKQAVPKVK